MALKRPIAPNVFNRNEETKSSNEKLKFLRYDVIRFNERYNVCYARILISFYL